MVVVEWEGKGLDNNAACCVRGRRQRWNRVHAKAAGCGTRDEGSVSNPAALLKGHKYIQCPFTIQPKL